MASLAKETVAVVGTTGIQGESVARTFLSLSHWNVRCLTRQPTSDKALELAQLGGEIVLADLKDEASLRKAFSNREASLPGRSHPRKERYQGRSNHPDPGKVRLLSPGTYACCIKWQILFCFPLLDQSEYRRLHRDLQVELAKKTSYIYIGAYTTNAFLYPQFVPQTGDFISILLTRKETCMPIINVPRSTGPFVRALVEDEEPRTKLLAYEDYLSIEQVVNIWKKALGKEFRLIQLTMEAMREKPGVPREILLGAAYLGEYSYCAGVSNVIKPARLKNRLETQSFKDWLEGKNAMELLGANK
ncbi:hypothetical protein N7532_005289 [Penicillium argentinense]|uniref:NmrA-like domain-containing protein n=1 Tax=Penicillium argentinense TaxID=1131581 RepID=A0A9W9FDM6_9EURO|nr:uncharacterized protein N7532_005289 [Penicillium argentinense]KAJ5098288.1 hypothetical protein N7532_005289 [Penicillium argentinense]